MFWALVIPAFLFAVASLRGERRRAAWYRRRLPDARQAGYLPPVTLIVPVKGPEDGLRENLASLAALDYPDYELIVAARRAADIPPGVVPAGARIVLSGDGDSNTGEKIRNLVAAIEAAAPRSEVFAFADSDGRVASGWLRALVAPLAGAAVGAAPGYRCYLPDPPDFFSSLRSLWDSAILGSFGPGGKQFAWGGAMAVRKDVFFRIGVLGFWRGSVSDDFGLTAASHRAGLEVRFAPGALVVSAGRTTARECLAWIRRQLVITRVYYPKLWYLSFAASSAYCGAMAACIVQAVRGDHRGVWALAPLLVLWLAKGKRRGALAQMALPEYRAWFQRYGWILTWGAPLASWVWLYGHFASSGSNVIEWRGNRYRLKPVRDFGTSPVLPAAVRGTGPAAGAGRPTECGKAGLAARTSSSPE